MSEAEEVSAFTFEGTWREYAPIAFTNLLLTIVTLGIYRFWATTRSRQYLWSRTRFIDDQLEWAGTGGELFKGALMAVLLVLLPLAGLRMLTQHLILSGHPGLGGLVGFVTALGFYVLIGTALFRALRYRLARTYWRGIRGGSDDPGLRYGWSYVWKHFVGALALGLMMPWAMVSLWNERWNAMTFGPYAFTARGRLDGLMGRFILCYLAPFIGIAMVSVVMVPAMIAGGGKPGAALGVTTVLAGFGVYFIMGLVVMAYYAKYFRQMVAGLSLHTLDFGFTARTMDWIKLYLGDVALVVCTLGVGVIFLNYRHWKFYVSHMHADGHIDVDELTQSATAAPSQGEGLLDAFDMGAF